MRRVSHWLVLVSLAVGLLALGLGGPAGAQPQKVLVIAIGADQTGLDPQTVQNNESGFVMSTIFDSVVNYKPGSSEIGPGLAESWTVSPDGKVFTFKLRRGVKFHDGTPMNARTVADDLDRAINPNNPCYVLARKGVDTYDDFTFGSVTDNTVAKMDVVDEYTLRFTLPDASAPFLSSLAMTWQGIMSPAATKQYNCDASQHPAGATTASQGMPPVLWGYNKGVAPYPYDVARAKALLAEAGFPNGLSTDMMVYANPRGYNPIGGAKLGEAVQGYLAKVGVNIKITQFEWGAYLDRFRHQPWEGFAITGWSGDNGDPDNFLGDLFEWDIAKGRARTNNTSRHHDPAYDRLLRDARRTTDQAKREKLYEQANKLLHDDAPWIFMNHTNQVRAARANVKGFLLNPLQMFFHMELVSLE